jgi:hypothetical protein
MRCDRDLVQANRLEEKITKKAFSLQRENANNCHALAFLSEIFYLRENRRIQSSPNQLMLIKVTSQLYICEKFDDHLPSFLIK